MDEPTRICPACLRKYPRANVKCPTCLCWMPTRKYIRAQCRKFQATWSPAEEQKRSTCKRVPAMTKLAEMVICTKE